jgi:hypothetical protein
MSGFKAGNYPNLYDVATGKLVGYISPYGKEHYDFNDIESKINIKKAKATIIDAFSTLNLSTNQYNNSTNAQLVPTYNGTPTVLSGQGPNGEDVLRFNLGTAAGASGRVGATIGAVSPANLGYSSGGLVGTTGLFGFWVRFNLDGTDSLDDTSANKITPINYVYANPDLVANYAQSASFNNKSSNEMSPVISGEWYFWRFYNNDRAGSPANTLAIDKLLHAFQPAQANAGRTTTIDIGPAYFNIEQSPSFQFSFDNLDASIYAAYQYLKSKGITGTLYTDPRGHDGGTHLTVAQVDEMYRNGWTIGLHGNTGTTADVTHGFYGQTTEFLNADVLPCLELLKARYGDGWKHLAWPLGKMDENAIRYMRNLGVLTARGTGSPTRSGLPLCIDDCYNIFAAGWFANTSTATVSWAQAKAVIDATIANKTHTHIWGHFYNGTNITILKQAVDYILDKQAQGLCEIIANAEDAYNRYILPSKF